MFISRPTYVRDLPIDVSIQRLPESPTHALSTPQPTRAYAKHVPGKLLVGEELQYLQYCKICYRRVGTSTRDVFFSNMDPVSVTILAPTLHFHTVNHKFNCGTIMAYMLCSEKHSWLNLGSSPIFSCYVRRI
jgi:hypothetical protein